jgi:hypothetical protein
MGIENLDVLLRPSVLVDALEWFAAEEASVALRPGIRLRALPTEQLIRRGPGLVVLNASEYAITVDAERGIMTRFGAYIAGRLARQAAVSHLVLDAPLDGTLFVPPSVGPSR